MSDLNPSTPLSALQGPIEPIRLLGHPDDVHPDDVHPDDVLGRPDLTPAEKRQVLAAWASDDHAVRDAPGFRRLDNGAVVSIDEILRALRTLDRADVGRSPVTEAPDRRRHPPRFRPRVFFGRRDDDDDDPPPSPAATRPLRSASSRCPGWDGGEFEPVAA